MPWPFTSDDKKSDKTWTSAVLEPFTSPHVLVATAILTAASVTAIGVYRSRLRRIPTAVHITPDLLRTRTIFGRVTSVGDGDNFRVYHTPGGRLAGWGWLPGRKVPSTREELKDETIHVRLAGVDAPEMPHFGKPGQPYGPEALAFLTEYVNGRNVRVQLWRRDQYERVVGTAYIRRGLIGSIFRRDVSLEMLKNGMATIYEAKFGSEFGDREQMYREAEEKAKKNGVGMWKEKSVWAKLTGATTTPETPREYKTRTKSTDKVKG